MNVVLTIKVKAGCDNHTKRMSMQVIVMVVIMMNGDTATSMKVAVPTDTASCSLADTDRHF
jgi:hypothetical protein